MRFSFQPARLPLVVTAVAVTAAAVLTGGTSAAFAADRAEVASSYAAGAAPSESRAASVADPLAHIADDATSALTSARAAIAFAGATERDVAQSGLDVDGATTIDTSDLAALTDRLSQHELTPLMLLPKQVTETLRATDAVNAAAGNLTGRLEQAKAVKAIADAAAAAAQAAAEAAAQAKAAAEAQAAADAQAAAEKSAAEKAAASASSAPPAGATSTSSARDGGSRRNAPASSLRG